MISNQILGLLSELAILFPAFLLVFTSRGFFKALFAKLMGDDTAQQEGFLTLNPLAHIDFLGLSIMLLLVFFIGGLFMGVFPRSLLFILLILLGARWTTTVPIVETNFKNYTLGVITTTLAGSCGNFILALLFLYILKYFPFQLIPHYAFITLVEIFNAIIELAIFFGVLNLIPIPPFDGGRLLQFILPHSWQHIRIWLQEYSFYILLILFFLPGINTIFFNFLFILSIFIKKGLLFLVF